MNALRKMRVRFLEMRVCWLSVRTEGIERRVARRIARINWFKDWRVNRLVRRADRLVARAEKINKKVK